jgi:hypothetical protein
METRESATACLTPASPVARGPSVNRSPCRPFSGPSLLDLTFAKSLRPRRLRCPHGGLLMVPPCPSCSVVGGTTKGVARFDPKRSWPSQCAPSGCLPFRLDVLGERRRPFGFMAVPMARRADKQKIGQKLSAPALAGEMVRRRLPLGSGEAHTAHLAMSFGPVLKFSPHGPRDSGRAHALGSDASSSSRRRNS